ncbi:calaxin-like isoform X2 [Acinonyx jubatus]|uniref:Calaxin-like isoform X2 n=1 Tax=Acinonyx jubatus TaxID=32536 RepID=A0ABM3PRY4_ACIJB|nr:calaxin-like isoform X2 [Acinonyx jubatus]
MNYGISDNPRHVGLELGYLRTLQCVEATLDMDQKTLKKLVESISNTVKNFKKSEVECLIRLFHSLVERANVRLNNLGLDRNAFRAILHSVFGMTDDMLMNRVCFEVYYLNGDGYISREEIFDMLKNSLHQQSSEEENDEGIKELVDITLKKMDYDNDGKISFADFEKAVREERLLLEVFGPCLPETKIQCQ